MVVPPGWRTLNPNIPDQKHGYRSSTALNLNSYANSSVETALERKNQNKW